MVRALGSGLHPADFDPSEGSGYNTSQGFVVKGQLRLFLKFQKKLRGKMGKKTMTAFKSQI